MHSRRRSGMNDGRFSSVRRRHGIRRASLDSAHGAELPGAPVVAVVRQCLSAAHAPGSGANDPTQQVCKSALAICWKDETRQRSSS